MRTIAYIDGVRTEALPNGYWLIRSIQSGLETLYDPHTKQWRGPTYTFAMETVAHIEGGRA
jgi:hypothetical protein